VSTPIAGQAEAARDKWRRRLEVEVAWANPARPDETAAAAASFRDPSLACIVLDCMGHDERHREEMERLTGKPVLLAQDVVARVAGALLGGGTVRRMEAT
jgi:protein AroM